MADIDIFEHINALSAEEERLYLHGGDGHGLSTDEAARLRTIEVELDRCYDLLHQRQGRRDAGLDPSAAALRSPGTVEGYEQ
jgi:hypothetical protein